LKEFFSKSSLPDGLDYILSHPVTVFHRFTSKIGLKDYGKEAVVNTKIREIFGVPHFVVLFEAVMFRETVETMSRKCGFISYGQTRRQQSDSVSFVREAAESKGFNVLCGDISSMDANLPVFSINYAIDFLLGNMINVNKYRHLIDAYKSYLIFTPIAWMSRYTSITFGGNVSGSLLTSWINSINVLFALQYAYFTLYGEFLEPGEVQVLGDDFIVPIKEGDKDQFITILGYFNLKVHSGKTLEVNPSEDILYLGFFWDRKGNPTQKMQWYIARICFPERYVDVAGYERILQRAASILYQIAGGGAIFKRVFINVYPKLRDAIERGFNFMVNYLDKTGHQYFVSLPFRELDALGWRAF
jgi:hypothetical protein